jgi:lipoprotein-anchoring transpeptidase ErfK/SrfK
MVTTPGPVSTSPAHPRAPRARRVATFLALCSTLAAVAVPTTAEAAQTKTKAHCPQLTTRKVACVDQDHQTMWIQQGSKIIMPAVRIRTGKSGRRTPDGTYHIWLRNRHQYSYLFDEPMPFSLFFHGDYALHGSYGDLRKGGSNGCVNLTVADAAKVFGILGLGDVVYIWGHKPR